MEPADLAGETPVTSPIDQERPDVFQHFLMPAGVQLARTRTCALTLMMVQLVASGRGVSALPNWVAAEYLGRDWVKALPLGKNGVWCTLFAAIRTEDEELAFVQDFLETAKATCMKNLIGIRSAA